MKLVSIIFYPEPQPVLFKDSESRKQKKQASLIFFAKTHPIFFKDSAR